MPHLNTLTVKTLKNQLDALPEDAQVLIRLEDSDNPCQRNIWRVWEMQDVSIQTVVIETSRGFAPSPPHLDNLPLDVDEHHRPLQKIIACNDDAVTLYDARRKNKDGNIFCVASYIPLGEVYITWQDYVNDPTAANCQHEQGNQ